VLGPIHQRQHPVGIQCLDNVGLASQRTCGLSKLSDQVTEALVWLYVSSLYVVQLMPLSCLVLH